MILDKNTYFDHVLNGSKRGFLFCDCTSYENKYTSKQLFKLKTICKIRGKPPSM